MRGPFGGRIQLTHPSSHVILDGLVYFFGRWTNKTCTLFGRLIGRVPGKLDLAIIGRLRLLPLK